MALMVVLESELRALSLEARRRYPYVKDAAEHAILKLRSLSGPGDIIHNEEILRIFLMACDVKSVKLSVIGLSCLQKLISHNAVSPSALKEILNTLRSHADVADESVQLKTLQTILIVFQSHLQPEKEDDSAKALGICLHLLENYRSSDSVRNTAAATFRQAVALIFDSIMSAEALCNGKLGSANQITSSSSVTYDVSQSKRQPPSLDKNLMFQKSIQLRDNLSTQGKVGLHVLEDLTALATGGSATWLRVHSLRRTFCLDILEFILSNYVPIFQTLAAYEKVLRHQICSLLMTSLRTNTELEGEAGEPYFRRLVLRSVAHVIRFYSSSLATECEVFLNMLLKVVFLDVPLWHRILVLEILRGFCVEARVLRVLYRIFDMDPKNTNVLENIVKALARVVSTIQTQESSEESLAAVAGMFSSKAKGIEWSMENDTSITAVVVASEAHAITLAVEGLLGVVFAVSTLIDEAVDHGELESPRCAAENPPTYTGKTATLCLAIVDSTWITILDALSLVLTRSQGEAIILEILKGYQAFIQACGVLRAVQPLNSFLASLCKFTISVPSEADKKSILSSPGSKKLEQYADQRENIVLTPKNVHALRTLFNIAHRLHNVLGASWVLVLETLAALDRAIHSPHASTQEVSTSVSHATRETSGQNSDFDILSSLNSQLFESSALMNISAVKSLLFALRQLSNQYNHNNSSAQLISSVSFAVERMTSVLENNLYRVVHIWDSIIEHLLELADSSIFPLRSMALDALDKSICAVLGSEKFIDMASSRDKSDMSEMGSSKGEIKFFECAVLSPLTVLYTSTVNHDIRVGTQKILLHVLERYGDKLLHSWFEILGMLRSIASTSEKDLIPLGFQSVRVIMNDGLSTMPVQFLDVCIKVTGAYATQRTEINISLTAIGLLWTTTDFIAKGLVQRVDIAEKENESVQSDSSIGLVNHTEVSKAYNVVLPEKDTVPHDKLLFSVIYILKDLGADERPEVRNSAIRTLFQILGSHGHKLSKSMWEDYIWNYLFPILDSVSHLAATSSRDEWQGKELGTRGGKAVHMLIHHSRNTAQKQWDETLVLVLGGITRILRSYFPFLQSLSNFSTSWDSLLQFVRDSISNGSKEVALAAINCLQTIVSSHCPRGNFSIVYLKSVLDVYELVLQKSSNYSSVANKVKVEILLGLGEIYVQAQSIFNDEAYLQLLGILNFAISQSKTISDNIENDFGSTSSLQRTILEAIPSLRPAEHLSSLWSHFFLCLTSFLPGSELIYEDDTLKQSGNLAFNVSKDFREMLRRIQDNFDESDKDIRFTHLFGEELVPILVKVYLEAPATEKCIACGQIVQALGRCMVTRRDYPNAKLWRVAVEGFNQVLSDDLTAIPVTYNIDNNVRKSARVRLWKEVADAYETFLVGSCGRALSSDTLSEELLRSDEYLEMVVLDLLGDKILKAQIDAPADCLQKLVLTLDRCASRTGSLPIETVELMPSHCGRFSLTCLKKIFDLCCYTLKEDWHPTRLEISKISAAILINRCKSILIQFLVDENDNGKHPLPHVRIEETAFVLKELASLTFHSKTAEVLYLPRHLKNDQNSHQSPGGREHLLVLFPLFCELVSTKEADIRNLVQVLLRLVTIELGLQELRTT